MSLIECILLILILMLAVIVFFSVRAILGRARQRGADRAVRDAKGTAPVAPRRFRKALQGTARDVEKREVSAKWYGAAGEDYLAFRLERNDDEGNIIELVPVEARAGHIPGRLMKDGDTVLVLGRRNRDGLIIPRRIYNATNKLEIRVRRHPGFFGTILALPLGLLFLASWPALICGIILLATTRDSNTAGIGFFLILAAVAVMATYYFIYIRR